MTRQHRTIIYAEHIIKKGVLKRKSSGIIMSLAGAKTYCALLSISQTCKLRDLSFYDFAKTSLVHYIQTGEPMLLSQYEMEFGQDIKEAI